MEIENFIKDLNAKLTAAGRTELQNILKLPEVDAIRGREEGREIEERRTLIERMKKAPGEHKAALAQAEKNAIAAVALIEKLHREMLAAKATHLAANAAFLSAELAPKQIMFDAEKELRRTADPRLGDYIFYLGEIDERVRHCCRITSVRVLTDFTGQRVNRYESNTAEVVAARAVLQDSIAELDAMQLEAVTRDEVMKRLNNMTVGLAGVLIQFELAPPRLNEFSHVKWDRIGLSREALEAANSDLIKAVETRPEK